MIEERLAQELDRAARSQTVDLATAMQRARANAPTLRRHRRALAGATIAATVIGVVGVGVGVSLAVRNGSDDGSPPVAGQPLITTAKPLNSYPAAEVTGVVQLVDGCVLVGGRVALFPPGATLTDDTISLPSGTTTKVGSEAEWSGGYFEVASTRDMAGSDEVFQALTECANNRGAGEVALVTPLARYSESRYPTLR